MGSLPICYISVYILPAAISSHSALVIVSWIAQTFLQLVLLPIIIVGHNIQGVASDKRADQTFKDAEAILDECMKLQAHLAAQDNVLTAMLDKVATISNLSRINELGFK